MSGTDGVSAIPGASKTLAASIRSLYTNTAKGRKLQKVEHIGLTKLALADPSPHFAAWVQAHGKPYINNTVDYSRRQATWLENLNVTTNTHLLTLKDS